MSEWIKKMKHVFSVVGDMIVVAFIAFVAGFLLGHAPCEESIQTPEDTSLIALDKDFERTEFLIRVRLASDERHIARMFEDAAGRPPDEGKRLHGFSHAPTGGPCTIFVPEPAYQRDYQTFQTWGHELAHCVFGSWHAPDRTF